MQGSGSAHEARPRRALLLPQKHRIGVGVALSFRRTSFMDGPRPPSTWQGTEGGMGDEDGEKGSHSVERNTITQLIKYNLKFSIILD